MAGPIDVANFLKNGSIGGGTISTVFGRTGDVVGVAGDYSVSLVTGAAPSANPTLTGTVIVPTVATGTSNTQAASTALVDAKIAAAAPTIPAAGTATPLVDAGTAVVGTSTSYARQDHVHPTDTSRAPLAPRVLVLASNSATPAINVSLFDEADISAQTAAITSFTSGLSGTPIDGQQLVIRIAATTAAAIAWGTSFQSSGSVALPLTTVTSRTITVGLRYNSTAAKWICLAADPTGY